MSRGADDPVQYINANSTGQAAGHGLQAVFVNLVDQFGNGDISSFRNCLEYDPEIILQRDAGRVSLQSNRAFFHLAVMVSQSGLKN